MIGEIFISIGELTVFVLSYTFLGITLFFLILGGIFHKLKNDVCRKLLLIVLSFVCSGLIFSAFVGDIVKDVYTAYDKENPTYQKGHENEVIRRVYVTSTGECYHSYNCRYLSNSKIPMTKSKAVSEGYRACSVCGGQVHEFRYTVNISDQIRETASVWGNVIGWTASFFVTIAIYRFAFCGPGGQKPIGFPEDPPPQLQQ